VKILKGWILAKESKTAVLTAKEKAVFVLKMARFDHMAPSLQSAFLELVLHVYGETSATKDLSQIEGAFMIGLRVKDPTTRNNFVQLLHRTVDRHGKVSPRKTHPLSFLLPSPHSFFSTEYWSKNDLSLKYSKLGASSELLLAQGCS
jgi:hypothetical protein